MKVTLIIIIAVVWVILTTIAYLFAKRAGERNWGEFILVNLIPIVGSVLSIWVYALYIGKSLTDKKVE